MFMDKDIVKTSMLPKVVFRVSSIPIKTPETFLTGKEILRIVWSSKRLNGQSNLEQKVQS